MKSSGGGGGYVNLDLETKQMIRIPNAQGWMGKHDETKNT